MRTQIRRLALAVAVSMAFGPAFAGDQYDAMTTRWLAKLAGPTSLDRTAPEVQAQLRAQADAAQRALESLQRDPAAQGLWQDLSDFANPTGRLASSAVTSNARRLLAMAQAYGTPGSPLYQDAKLAEGIVFGLDWLLREHYHPRLNQYGNWWDWQIGTPQHLLNALTLARDAIPPALRQRSLAAVNWYVPDARYKTRPDGSLDRNHLETAANLLDKAQVQILSGVLGKDDARIAAGRDAIGPAFEYVTTGDGFYRDGSFIQHGYTPYAGNYGAVALQVYGRLLYLLDGSAWRITDPNAANVFTWARLSFADLLIDGAMPDAMRGRKMSKRDQSDHSVGRGVVAALAAIADVAPPAEQASLRAAIKGAMQRDRTFGNDYLAAAGGAGTSGLSLHDLDLLKKIADNPAIPAAAEERGARLYPSMDRAILRGPGFAAVLSMTSPRTSSFETGNGDNLQPWWTGMGMLALYDAHQEQFGQDYWATVNLRRLPGTTTDGSGKGRPVDWKQYPNTETWVGGVQLGGNAAIGMAFNMREVTGSGLHGRKSWFLLGERILALGSGIAGGEGKVETIVENRRLADPAGARLLVDGAAMADGKAAHARWAFLQDDKAGSRIGYVFPQGASLQVERSTRRGNWRAIDEAGSLQERSNSYQLLSIPQTSSGYAYLLMPNASQAATRDAARNPGLRIEANNEEAAAVSVAKRGLYAANLWRAGSAPRQGRNYVWSSGPAAVLVSQVGKQLQLAVAEPTQNAAQLEIALNRPVKGVISLAPGVTVLQLAPQLRLRVDSAGAAGATFSSTFTVDEK